MKPQQKVEIEKKKKQKKVCILSYYIYKQNHATTISKCGMPENKQVYTIFQRDQFKFTIKEVYLEVMGCECFVSTCEGQTKNNASIETRAENRALWGALEIVMGKAEAIREEIDSFYI